MSSSGPLVTADPGHGLGQLGDRVVRVHHGPVPGGALGGQAQPRDPPLRGLHQVESAPADRDAVPADLTDRLGDTLEQARVLVHQPVRAPPAARLLVRGEHEQHITRRPPTLPQPLADDRQDHGVHVLHVHRAAAPDAAVGDLAGERIVPPVGRVGRHDVKVTVDQQGWPGRVLPRDPRCHGGTLWMRLQDQRLEPGIGQDPRDVFGRLAFPRPRMITGVAGVDPDQVAADRDDFVVAPRSLKLGSPSLLHRPTPPPPRRRCRLAVTSGVPAARARLPRGYCLGGYRNWGGRGCRRALAPGVPSCMRPLLGSRGRACRRADGSRCEVL